MDTFTGAKTIAQAAHELQISRDALIHARQKFVGAIKSIIARGYLAANFEWWKPDRGRGFGEES